MHGVLCSLKSKQTLLKIFPFHSKDCQKECNMRSRTESVNPCFDTNLIQTVLAVKHANYISIIFI